VALIALMAGFLVAERTRSEKLLWAVLILAPLVRETGVLLLAGTVVARAAREGIPRASRLLIALAPFLTWVAFVHAHAAPQPYERSLLPMSAIVGALLDPRPYAGRPPGTVLAHQVADAVAVLGMLWAFVMTLLGIRRWREQGQATALLFVAMGLVLQRRDHWDHVFDFGRVYSPVLLVLLRDGLMGRTRLSLAVLPSVLVLTRVATQLASQVHGVVAGLLGSSGRGM
jgi:hypothetical protein